MTDLAAAIARTERALNTAAIDGRAVDTNPDDLVAIDDCAAALLTVVELVGRTFAELRRTRDLSAGRGRP